MNVTIITMTQHLHRHLKMDLFSLHSVPPLICPQLSFMFKLIIFNAQETCFCMRPRASMDIIS
jgi:hypothetical protein